MAREQRQWFALAWLVVAAIAPIVAFSAGVAWVLLDRQKTAVEEELSATSRALLVAVDRELASELAVMEVIATDQSLDNDDLAGFGERARRVMAKHPSWLDVVLVDPHSYLIVAGALGRPAPAPTTSSPPSIDKVMATGKPVIVGAFAKGKIIERPMILLMAPVIRNGEIRYVMTVVLNQIVISSIFAEQNLPPNWTASAIDSDLRIAGRSRNPEQYVGRPATPLLSQRIAAAETGMFQGRTQEGDRVYTVFSRSPLTGWTMAMGIPADEVEGPIRRTVTGVVAAGTALVALALVLAGFFARVIIARRRAYEEAQEKGARQLAHEADRYQFLLKTASDGIHVLDDQGNLIEASDSFLRMLGYARGQISGLNVRDWDALHPPEEFAARLADHLARSSIFETKHRRADGSIFDVEVLCHGVKLDGRDYIYGSSRDITERKMAEKSIVQSKEQAEMASRSKTEILANMSHELRTPLNAVIGYSEALLTGMFGKAPTSKFEEYINDIHGAGQHLLRIINDILDVSAIDAGKIELYEESVSVGDIVETSIRLIAPRAEKAQVVLSDEVPQDLPPLRADARRLKQIVLNLLSNAVKFTPMGGAVKISARVARAGEMEIVVADTGIGMDQAGIAKALSMFGQVESGLARSQEGSGLGLPLTKGLVELHGGTLDIASEKGTGTTVTVAFPALRIEAA